VHQILQGNMARPLIIALFEKTERFDG